MSNGKRTFHPNGLYVDLGRTKEEDRVMGKRRLALLGLVILIAAGFALLLGGLRKNTPVGEVVAAGVPDPDDVQEIQATIVEASKVGYVARLTHDVSGFASVLVDDPDVPLTGDQRDQLRDWLGTVPEGAGYLTYCVAGYHNTERLNRLSEEAWARARAAGRDHITPEDYLTAEELREIEESGGPVPPPPPAVRQPTMSPEEYAHWKWENTRFESVVITGDRASVTYDNHWFVYQKTLVRRDGKWYIAGSHRIGGSSW